MEKRNIRMGIDVGGTHTKAVAIDNDTHEIIGISQVKTTHDHPDGVAAGVVQSFTRCMLENGIAPGDIIFVAHSTTQATNALVEGDVAHVGVLALAAGGLEGLLAKSQSRIDDIDLGNGKKISVSNRFLKKKKFHAESVQENLDQLAAEGAQVIVSSMAFGVDDNGPERVIADAAAKRGLFTTMASDITKLYGLTRRTRTACINASILPKMMDTALSTERSVRAADVGVPLMIMRGDGGVMDINEMKKRPVLTMLSGPAASVMGSLMYLRASNGVYFEVGGTTTNIGVIKNGRPAIDYTIIGGHRTYVNSLDVRVIGDAGGSMIRMNREGVFDVGPRSAHIAGLEYAVFTPEDEVVDPKLEFISPRPGDPEDYAAVRLANGRLVAITNTCAANALGLVEPKYFSYGNQESARRAIQPLAEYTGRTVEEIATQILDRAVEKIKPIIDELAEKYRMEPEQMSFVGVGGGAASLICYYARKYGIKYHIPQNAEVISSIGVALSMVRDVVERVIPNPTSEEIRGIKQEAVDKAIESGAVPESIEVHIEIESQTQKVTAIALGSTEVKTTDLLKACSEEEALELAKEDFGPGISGVRLECTNGQLYVFAGEDKKRNTCLRVLDRKGFIKVQRNCAVARKTTAADYESVVDWMWDELAEYKGDSITRPDFYLCAGGRVMDFSGSIDINNVKMLMELEMSAYEPDYEVMIIGAALKL